MAIRPSFIFWRGGLSKALSRVNLPSTHGRVAAMGMHLPPAARRPRRMARSTRKSLAGSAAAAAKKVISRRPSRPADGPDTTSSTASATKAAVKKTTARKTAKKPAAKPVAKATQAAVKKTAAKTAKKPAAKKTATTSTPAAKAPAKRVGKQPATTTTGVRTVTAKKTATTKTAPSKVGKKMASPASLAVKEGEDPWTQAELDEVLAELHEHADRLRTELHDQEEELAGLMRDAGDGAGQDQADLGATSFERDHELTVVNNSREMLAQTERALARIEDGTYGVCESCGEPIGKMRVMAFPRATLCMSCKQREERR